MATVTPNFNWPVPTSTDLVKDGATAIEALGDSIDASLVDLKGGTTGQVLSKNSNTDMDFVWVTDAAGDITGVTAGTGISGGGTSGTVTVTNSMATAIDAKGDLIAGTGADAFSRIAVGTNGQVLKANSAAATGLEWGSASAAFIGCSVWSSTNQTITNTTATAINFDSELFDTSAFHSTTVNNSRITIPSGLDGKYLVTSKVDFLPNANGTRVVYHYINGSLINFVAYPVSSSSQGSSLNLSGVYNLTAGQYVESAAYQDSGSSITSTGTAYYYNNLQVTYLGA